MKKSVVVGLSTILAGALVVVTALAQAETPSPSSAPKAATTKQSGQFFFQDAQSSAPAGAARFGGGGFGGSGGFGGGSGMTFSTNPMAAPFGRANGEAEKLARDLSQAKSESDRETLTTKLNKLLETQFEQRQKKHEEEIQALEEQIKKLKDLVKTRSENRKEIVSRRLEQMVRDAKGLGW